MGVESVIGGLFGLAGAGISAVSSSHVQSAQAAAQADLNQRTMNFNRSEAKKARQFSASQASIDRRFNKAEALAARSFTAAQAKQMMDFNSGESSLARAFNADEAVKARAFDAQQSFLARQFEERLSSSAHQREVQDLYAAGLNPILSATGGNGASTPVAPIIASPMASSPAASASLGSSALASHSGSGTVAASVGALNALQKGNFLGNFVSSALDIVKATAELKKAQASDKEADAALKNAETHRYAEDWRYWLESKKVNISQAEANARIDKLNNEVKIAWQDLDIRKELKDASVEERKAMVHKLEADVDVSREQAALLGLNQEELKRKMRYGSVLMTYLPADVRDKVAAHMIDFIAENGDIINDFLHKSSGDIFDYKDGHEFFEKVCLPKIDKWLNKKGW